MTSAPLRSRFAPRTIDSLHAVYASNCTQLFLAELRTACMTTEQMDVAQAILFREGCIREQPAMFPSLAGHAELLVLQRQQRCRLLQLR